MTEKIPQFNISPARELKTELNPGQRHYLDKLVARLNKILDGRTKEQMIADKDIAGLEKYLEVTTQLANLLKHPKYEGIEPEFVSGEEYTNHEKARFSVDEIRQLIKDREVIPADQPLILEKVLIDEEGKIIYLRFVSQRQELFGGKKSVWKYVFNSAGEDNGMLRSFSNIDRFRVRNDEYLAPAQTILQYIYNHGKGEWEAV